MVSEVDEADVARELVGRRITSVDGMSMTLDDGTVLELSDTFDVEDKACAWFEPRALELLGTGDNVITSVDFKWPDGSEWRQLENPGEADEHGHAPIVDGEDRGPCAFDVTILVVLWRRMSAHREVKGHPD